MTSGLAGGAGEFLVQLPEWPAASPALASSSFSWPKCQPRPGPGPPGDLVLRPPAMAACGTRRGLVMTGPTARLTAWVEGRVQGVGFRWWVRARALERGLAGIAENLVDGRVKVIAEGPADGCSELLALLDSGRTPGLVRRVTHRWDEPRGGFLGFTER